MILSPVAGGYLADFLLGDPEWRWHPVRLMGAAIAFFDARMPRTRLAGTVLALGLPAFAGFTAWIILRYSGGAAWILNATLVFFCLAGSDMLKHANAVLTALEKKTLPEARLLVGRIVGRDTEQLDEAGVLRACVESTAESFCDGLLAPLFYAFLGGAPLALAYKAVSTLDSMVGYKNEKYAVFGRASARLDDALNFIPARLSALLVALASARPLCALACAVYDGPGQPSPNSGWPEAAFAGALRIQLGGELSYAGVPSLKSTLGVAERPINLEVARQALRLFQRASLLAVVLGELLWHFLRG